MLNVCPQKNYLKVDATDIHNWTWLHQWKLHEKCPNTEFSLVRISRIRTEYGVSLHIHSEYRKIRTRKTPYLDTFNAVEDLKKFPNLKKYSSSINKEAIWRIQVVIIDFNKLISDSIICSSIRLIFQKYCFSGVGDLTIISSCFNLFLSLGLQFFFCRWFQWRIQGVKRWPGCLVIPSPLSWLKNTVPFFTQEPL